MMMSEVKNFSPVEKDQSSEVTLIPGVLGKSETVEARRCVVTRKGEGGIVLFGPYEHRRPGRYRVEFDLGLAGEANLLGDPVVANIEVVTNSGTTWITERRLLLSDLSSGLSAHALEFTIYENFILEYRLASTGQIALNFSGSVRVSALPPALPSPQRGSKERAWEYELEYLDGYLRNVSGVIHVGANIGQERRYYWLLGMDVIWVEPIKEAYDRLVSNIAGYTRQRPIYALLADKDGEEFEFRIANNGGASSSILPFEDHARLWPGIEYVETRKIVSKTLDAMMAEEAISTDQYQALTLDVEGAEMLILKGATEALKSFQYVKCEVADFPARTGTPSAADLDDLLQAAGYNQIIRRAFAMGPNNEGTYWDIVWKKVVPGEPLNKPGIQLPVVAHPYDVDGLEKCE